MKRIFIICLLAMATISVNAQVIELDLDKAIEIALNENPTIQIANLEIERYDYVRREAIGNHLPSLSATATYSHSIIQQTMLGNMKFQGDDTYMAAASLTLPLIAPTIIQSIKLSKEQMLGAVEAARSSKIALINNVKKTYYMILLGEQSIEVLGQSEKTISDMISNMKTMYANEMISEYDVITAEVQLSNIRPNIIQAKNGVEVAKMMLRMYLNLPESVEIKLDNTLSDFRSGIEAADYMLSTDISENSDLAAMDLQKNVLNRQLKLLKTQRMRMLAAFGNAQIMGYDKLMMNFLDPQAIPYNKFTWQKPTSIGVQLSVPIFSGLTKVNKERQLKNSIKQFTIQREYAEEGMSVQVKSAINSIITAREKINANEKTMSQAEKAFNIAKTRYMAGAGTILELNNAELTFTRTKLDHASSMQEYLAAEADYEKIIGKE